MLDLRCAKEKKERVHELYLDKQEWSSCFTVRMLYIYVMGESDALMERGLSEPGIKTHPNLH